MTALSPKSTALARSWHAHGTVRGTVTGRLCAHARRMLAVSPRFTTSSPSANQRLTAGSPRSAHCRLVTAWRVVVEHALGTAPERLGHTFGTARLEPACMWIGCNAGQKRLANAWPTPRRQSGRV